MPGGAAVDRRAAAVSVCATCDVIESLRTKS
jgi:hypothetical protein